ncbi:hypothetical protein [Gimesia aquarii]|uniref:Uncharacterized protein n=1 Tax=Gimesia aquarii TaxID=2527964 RepID=A0A517WQD4_9PLAN|nr:hypothetical protein [Gimesia aquarii]QDU07472.1 hypothetical protein V202x_08280 [Gimesia aquarii]
MKKHGFNTVTILMKTPFEGRMFADRIDESRSAFQQTSSAASESFHAEVSFTAPRRIPFW